MRLEGGGPDHHALEGKLSKIELYETSAVTSVSHWNIK